VESGRGTVYVDGTNVYSNTWTGVNQDEQIRIGVENEGSGFYWRGEINEVIFMSEPVTASEAYLMHRRMSSGSAYCQQVTTPEPTPAPAPPSCSTMGVLKAYYNARVSNVENGVWLDLTGNFPAIMRGPYTASGATLQYTSFAYADLGMTKASFKSTSDNSWTVGAWVKFIGSPTRSLSAIVGGFDPLGATEFFIGKLGGNTCLGLQDGEWRPDACSTVLFDGEYHSVVVSMASGRGTVYVDGANVYSNTWTGVNKDEQIRIGVENEGSGFYWHGEINEVLFLSEPVTPSEALSMHHRMSTGSAYCQQAPALAYPLVLPSCSARTELKAYYNARVSNVASGIWSDLTGNFPARMRGAYEASGEMLHFTSSAYAETGMTKSSFKSSSDNSWTVAAWVKFTGLPTQHFSAIVGGFDPLGATEFFIGKLGGNTCLGLQDGEWRPDACSTPLFDGEYHSVVVSMASGRGTVYVDGTDVYSNTWTGVNQDEQIRIGVENEGPGFYWQGEINEVIFLNKPVTADEAHSMHRKMYTGSAYC